MKDELVVGLIIVIGWAGWLVWYAIQNGGTW